MKFYYSGADSFGAIQQNIDKSLGGFMSGSVVPNDFWNGLFSDISQIDRNQLRQETRAIFLKNETGAPVTNVKLYYDNSSVSGLVKIEVAAVTSPDQKSIEKIGNIRSIPYIGTFIDMTGIGNEQVLIANLANNAILGLWIRRTILPNVPLTCSQLNSGTVDESDETITFHLSWN